MGKVRDYLPVIEGQTGFICPICDLKSGIPDDLHEQDL